MSNLKNKSELNFESAMLLHKNSFYPSVIHCSYYSVFQYMKHIWLDKMGKTEVELQILNKQITDKGSHEVLINQINSWLKDKGSDYRIFNNNIGALKKLRKKADYENVGIDSVISYNSIELSKQTTNILKGVK